MLESILPHLKKILMWITLKRVIMLGLGLLVWIFSLTMFENRAMLYDSLTHKSPIPNETTNLTISDEVARKIKIVSDGHPELNFIMVAGANIAMNQRELIYWYTNNPQVEVDIRDHITKNGKISVLLGRNEESNIAIIRAINGEFVCYDNANSLIVSNLNLLTKKICRVSIPPYYGQFSGYLTFGVSKDLTPEQLSVLRHDAVEITREIYFNNLKRLQR